MAIQRKATSLLEPSKPTKDLDFRSPNDEAWYTVRLLKVTQEVLRLIFLHFPETEDEWYIRDQFESLQQIQEFITRFRLPAQQLQDSQCRQVTPGKLVIACHTSSTGAVMFYDALLDSVSRSEHESDGASEEEMCPCKFHVTWKQGPEKGKHATVRIGDICLIQESSVEDPVLKDFIESAKSSLEERMGN